MTQGPPPLARYGALSLFYFACNGLFSPYSPLWFQSLGFSTLFIGGIASLLAWTRIFAPYAWSWFGDHSGRRVELIRLSALGAVLSALGLMGVQAAWPVAAVCAMLFVANAGVVPLSEAALTHLLHTEDGVDPGRYGRVRVWGSVGFIVSVLLFGALLEYTGIGLFPALMVLMNGLLLLAALRLPATREEAVHDEPAPPVLHLLRQPEVAWFFASIFFTVLAHTALYAFFSLYLDAMGYSKAAVGALWAISVVGEIAFFWTQGRWVPLLSPHRWLLLVALATALRFAATAQGGMLAPVLVLAQLSHVLTFAAHHASCVTLLNRHFNGRLRGRGQALYTTLGYGVSGLLGGVGGGWIIGHLGYAAVFWAASLCALAAAACVLLSERAMLRVQTPGDADIKTAG